MWKIKLQPHAQKDCRYWQKHNPKYLKKTMQLLKAIQHNPFKGIGKPEPLQYNLQSYWSRQISKEHRVLYEIEDNTIFIHSCPATTNEAISEKTRDASKKENPMNPQTLKEPTTSKKNNSIIIMSAAIDDLNLSNFHSVD